MSFDNIQDTIAERIGSLKKACSDIETALNSADMDLNSPIAQQLYNRQVRFQENLNMMENLAFFIIQQENELETLRAKSDSDSMLIQILREANRRERLNHNAARASLNLLEFQKNHWNADFLNELKSALSDEEYTTLISHSHQKIAA